MFCRIAEPEISRCWQYHENAQSIPAWVARKCHNLGDGKLTVNGFTGIEEARYGDWIIYLEDDGVCLIRRDDFNKAFVIRESESDEWRQPE